MPEELVQHAVDIAVLVEEGRETGFIPTIGLTKEEWLRLRKVLGIGASEIGAMMGLSQYKTPYQLWAEKVAEVIVDEDNPSMKRGRMMEEVVALMYAEETGRTVRRDNKIRIHPECEYVFASLDRTIVDNGDGRGPGLLECKTVSGFAMKSWETEIPTVYYLQVQQQLAVTGYTWGVIAVLNIDTFELHTIEFTPDEKIISTILTEVNDFWTKYVIPEVEPPMVAADFSKFYRTDESVITATEEVKALIEQTKEAKAKKEQAEEVEDALKNELKLFMGEHNVLVDVDGKPLLTWKSQTKKSYVVKESTSRVMRFKQTKKED